MTLCGTHKRKCVPQNTNPLLSYIQDRNEQVAEATGYWLRQDERKPVHRPFAAARRTRKAMKVSPVTGELLLWLFCLEKRRGWFEEKQFEYACFSGAAGRNENDRVGGVPARVAPVGPGNRRRGRKPKARRYRGDWKKSEFRNRLHTGKDDHRCGNLYTGRDSAKHRGHHKGATRHRFQGGPPIWFPETWWTATTRSG